MQAVALYGKSVVTAAVAAAILTASASPALAQDYASFAFSAPGPVSARTGVASNLRLSVPLGTPRAAKAKPSVGLNLAPTRAADFVRPVATPSGFEAGFSLAERPYLRVGGEEISPQAREKLGFTAMQDGGGNRTWWIVGGVVLVAALVLLADDDGGGY